jgi:hypothetical protein
MRTLSPQIPSVEAAVPEEAAISRNVEHSADNTKNSGNGGAEMSQHVVRYTHFF